MARDGCFGRGEALATKTNYYKLCQTFLPSHDGKQLALDYRRCKLGCRRCQEQML